MEQTSEFTLSDLVNLQKIIEVASQRGAFRAEELKDVGITYERLTKFIQSVKPEDQPKDQLPPSEPTQGD